MKYPIVKAITDDNLELFGFLAEAEEEKDSIFINTFWTPAFAGVTGFLTSYENINNFYVEIAL